MGELILGASERESTIAEGLGLRSEATVPLDVDLDASRIAHFRFRARGSATMIRFAWQLAREARIKPYRRLSFPLLQGDDEEVYRLNLGREPYWNGRVGRLEVTAQGGDLELVELTALPPATAYRDMALKGVSMPSLPGRERIEMTAPAGLGKARFETYLGLVPEYQRPGVEARFRAYVESDGERVLWLDQTLDGASKAWRAVGADVTVPAQGRLVLEASASLEDRPLPQGVAVWGNPLLLKPASPQKNLLLVVIDTLRTDVVGSYGNDLGLTPHLDAFARRSVRLSQLYAPAPWTLPSVASLMTGLQPQTHGAGRRVDGFAPTGLPDTSRTLAEVLAAQGYFTSALYHNIYLNPAFGLQQGFDLYASHETRAGFLVDRALEQLTELGDRPFFLYLHLFDPHNPYEPPTEDCHRVLRRLLPQGPLACAADRRPQQTPPPGDERPWIEALYRAEVSYTDRQIGRLLDALDLLDLADQTVIAIVSDHGEDFWHRLAQEELYGYNTDGDHGHTHYRELLHLVGMIHIPGEMPKNLKRQAEMVDLFPTLLRLLEVEPPPSQGRDLLVEPDEPGSRRPGMIFDSLLYGPDRWAIQHRGWKLVVPRAKDRRAELYDLRADPHESQNLVNQRPDLAAQLRESGEREIESRQSARLEFLEAEDSFSPTYLEWRHITKLRALGYLK